MSTEGALNVFAKQETFARKSRKNLVLKRTDLASQTFDEAASYKVSTRIYDAGTLAILFCKTDDLMFTECDVAALKPYLVPHEAQSVQPSHHPGLRVARSRRLMSNRVSPLRARNVSWSASRACHSAPAVPRSSPSGMHRSFAPRIVRPS